MCDPLSLIVIGLVSVFAGSQLDSEPDIETDDESDRMEEFQSSGGNYMNGHYID